jgi:hypothetical protein
MCVIHTFFLTPVMPSEQLMNLCTSTETITRALEKEPSLTPGEAAAKLFPKASHPLGVALRKSRSHEEYTVADLDAAEKCGKFPYRPSDLFLKVWMLVKILVMDCPLSNCMHHLQIYSDILNTLEHNSLNGMVSPSLLGSSGVIPVSIISL